MTKCYTIEQGSYSDYRVVGIFTTREMAAQALAYITDPADTYEQPSIEERELNPAIDQLNEGLSQFGVHIMNSGETTIQTRRDLEPDDTAWDNGCFYHVWARDSDHALKIATDKHTQYLARKTGLA